MENKCCVKCIYFNERYCVRKKQVVKHEDYCLHYVCRMSRHSLEKLIDNFVSQFLDEK